MTKAKILLLLIVVLPVFYANAGTGPQGKLSLHAGLRFEENKGQFTKPDGTPDKDVLYVMKDRGITVFFTPTGVKYKWHYTESKDKKAKQNFRQKEVMQTAYAGMVWAGANTSAQIVADSAYTDVSNYIYQCKNIAGVKSYHRITYKNLYLNTDVVYYIKNGKLEYDVILHPGADAGKVKFIYTGDSPVKLENGKLHIKNSMGTLTEDQPIAFINNRAVEANYIASGNNITFELEGKNRFITQKTIIDPTITWGTFLGGAREDAGTGTATDAAGNVYLSGYTNSSENIASPGSGQSGGGGDFNYDAMLIKFDANGNRLWATYYGGTSYDYGTAVTTDNAGNVIMVGYTRSQFMATAGAAQGERADSDYDAFVAKFNSNGFIIWSSYWGGKTNQFGIVSGEDVALAVATDSDGGVYFTGYTYSQEFPIKSGAYQNDLGGNYDAFVAKFNSAGAAVFSTYFGGNGDDEGRGITVSNTGVVYVCGLTNSTNKIATDGAFQTGAPTSGRNDAFLARFTSGGGRIWATYYGAFMGDEAHAIATDSQGDVYITGFTENNTGIATTGAFQTSWGGNKDAFVAKFKPNGARVWGTYYGGSADDMAYAITINANDDIYIGGSTKSMAGIANAGFKDDYAAGAFPTTTDGWVAKLNKTGNNRLWGSYLGGSENDVIRGISLFGDDVYLAGTTASLSGIAGGAFQYMYGGGVSDGFLMKINDAAPAAPINASNIEFSELLATEVRLTWENGNGNARIVVAQPLNNSFTLPTNGVEYAGNSSYTLAPSLGSGKIVYQGTGNAVTITNLAQNTLYYFKVYDYTGAGAERVYYTDDMPGNPNSVTTTMNGQTIAFNELPIKIYGDEDFAPGATATSTLAVTYTSDNPSVATIVDGKIHIAGAGSANITASQAGNSTWAAAPPVVREFLVDPATLTITAENKTKTYRQANPALTWVATGYVNGENSSVFIMQPTVATVATQASPAGDYAITVTGGSTLNYMYTYVNGTLAVGKADLTVTAENKTKTQGTVNPPLTVTYSGFIIPDNIASLTTAPTATTVATNVSAEGEYPIIPAGGVSTNYNFIYVNGTLTITPGLRPQTITFAPFEPVFVSEGDFYANGSASSGLPVSYVSSNTNVAIILPGDAEHGPIIRVLAAGTTTITASQGGNDVFAAAPNVARVLAVSKNDQVFIFQPFADVHINEPDFSADGQTDSGLPITYTSSNPAVAVIINGDMIRLTGLGTTTITASQAGNAQWNPAGPISRTLTVTKEGQYLDLTGFPEFTYGDPDYEPEVVISSALPVTFTSSNTAVATITPDGKFIRIVGGGTTTITASQPGNDKFFAAESSSKPLTVARAEQTLTFPPIDYKLLGDADFNLVASTTSGLPLVFTSSHPSIATVNSSGRVHIVADGNTTITVSQPGNANYKPTESIDRVLSIFTQEPQTITFPPFETVPVTEPDFYAGGTSDSRLRVTYTSSNTAVATIVPGDATDDLIHIVGVGATTITARQAGNELWLAATPVSRTLTVVKASQMIAFAELPAKLGLDADFDPGATATSGLTVSYTSSNTSVATIVNGRIHIIGAGTTNITASQAGNPTYNAAENITQTLTVNKVAQTINFASIPELVAGENYTLEATASSGLPVTFTISNTALANVSGNTLSPARGGTITVTAAQAGNNIYAEATSVSQTVTIIQDMAITIHNVITPNGDGFNDTFIVNNIGYYPGHRVSIFDSAGREVYHASNYNNNWAGTNSGGGLLSPGGYYYLVDLGNGTRYRGSVNIIRN